MLQLPRFMHATYLVDKITELTRQDITDFCDRLLKGCMINGCNMFEDQFIKCCGKPKPYYLVHDTYFPEPEDTLAWSPVSVGWRFASVPRILNDQWYVNLKSGDIWVNTSTTYFA